MMSGFAKFPLSRRLPAFRCCIAGAALALCGGAGFSAMAATFEMKIGVSTPEGYSYNLALAEFERIVEEETGGEVEVTVFPSAQLGGELEMVKNVQLGTLEATVVSTSNTSPFHKPYQALSVPYLLKSISCGLHVVNGPIGEDLTQNLLDKAGIRTLGWYTFGYRQLFNTKRDVKTLADLKGLKIRVPPDRYLELTWRTLGASPVPMPFPELFSALQQGVVDGDANPISSIKQFKWYEVVKHVSYANVAVGLGPFMVNEQFFQKLPADYQEVVLKAATASETVNLDADAKATEEAITFLENEGVTFVHPDLAEIDAALGPVRDEAKNEFGEDFINSILSAQDGC